MKISRQLSPGADKTRVRSMMTLRQNEVIKLFGTITFEPDFSHKAERAKR